MRGWRTAFNADDGEFEAHLGQYEEQCLRGWGTADNFNDAKVGDVLAGTAKIEVAAEYDAKVGP